MIRRVLIALVAVLASLVLVATPAAAATHKATGRFVAGSSTDRLRSVSGTVTFTQAKPGGTITVSGSLSGLEPNKGYVAVPYKDGACLPTPGITAFPSGAFYTDAAGRVTIPAGVTVNPRAINPLGSFNVTQTRSVSVRQIVVSAIALPGIPVGTPTVPNVAVPEACDQHPTRK